MDRTIECVSDRQNVSTNRLMVGYQPYMPKFLTIDTPFVNAMSIEWKNEPNAISTEYQMSFKLRNQNDSYVRLYRDFNSIEINHRFFSPHF